jgi:Tfp pilus assembly protein PilV
MLSPMSVYKLRDEQGLSLLEVVLAIAIVVISLTALVAIANTSSQSVGNSRSHTIADQYVREGLEMVRNIRDNNEGGRSGWDRITRPIGTSGTPTDISVGHNAQFSVDATGELRLRTVSGTASRTDTACADYIDNATTNGWYGIGSGYYRIVHLKRTNLNEVEVQVRVCYGAKDRYRSAFADTVLTNWR